MGCIALVRCVLVLRCGLAGVVWYPYAVLQPAYGYRTTPPKPQRNSYQSNTTHEIAHQISRKLLRMAVLTSETCWALNNEIKKQVTSSWSLFIQLPRWCTDKLKKNRKQFWNNSLLICHSVLDKDIAIKVFTSHVQFTEISIISDTLPVH